MKTVLRPTTSSLPSAYLVGILNSTGSSHVGKPALCKGKMVALKEILVLVSNSAKSQKSSYLIFKNKCNEKLDQSKHEHVESKKKTLPPRRQSKHFHFHDGRMSSDGSYS